MGQDIKDIYRQALAFAAALPLLFLVPVLAEAAQHIVEVRIGMYDGKAGAIAAANDMARMGWGFLKTLALLLPGYWFVRYMGFGGDARRARAVEMPAALLFLVIFAVQGSIQALTLFGPGMQALGLEGSTGGVALGAMVLLQIVVSVYLSAWLIAWPLGNTSIGPVRSFGIMAGRFWRSVGYLLAGVIPLMVLHYALGLGAIGRPTALVWAMLTLDTVVVGFLALTMMGSIFVAARHAAERKGVALVATER